MKWDVNGILMERGKYNQWFYMRFSGIHHPGELHESIQAITAITTIYIYIHRYFTY